MGINYQERWTEEDGTVLDKLLFHIIVYSVLNYESQLGPEGKILLCLQKE